jgi:hypothetical protein
MNRSAVATVALMCETLAEPDYALPIMRVMPARNQDRIDIDLMAARRGQKTDGVPWCSSRTTRFGSSQGASWREPPTPARQPLDCTSMPGGRRRQAFYEKYVLDNIKDADRDPCQQADLYALGQTHAGQLHKHSYTSSVSARRASWLRDLLVQR